VQTLHFFFPPIRENRRGLANSAFRLRPVSPANSEAGPGAGLREGPSAAPASRPALHRPAIFSASCLHLLGRGHAAAKNPLPRIPAIGPRFSRTHGLHHVGHVPVHLSSLLTSSTLTPAPAAMRYPCVAGFRTSGLLRSCRVNRTSITATWRFRILSSRARVGDLVLHFRDAGHHAHQAADAAQIRHLQKLPSRMSARSNWPLRIFSATRAAFSASILAAAFSTSDTTSPRRECALRSGSGENLPARRSFRLRVPISLDRFAGEPRASTVAAAPPRAIAVNPRQHDAGEADALVERPRQVDPRPGR